VEICTAPNSCSSNFAWVPFPAPGGPSRTTRALAAKSLALSTAQPATLHEPFIVPTNEMGFHLRDSVQCDADDN